MFKSVAERSLVAAGVATWSAARHRRDVCILAYHNIVPDDLRVAGDTSLHVRLRDFRAHLDYVERRYAVVPLTDALNGADDASQPRVAITFDDAYQGALVLGIEELARRGLPATLFVAPGILGHRALWWDMYAPPDGPPDAPLTPAMRHEALAEHGGQQTRVEAWASRAGWVARDVAEHMLTATESDLSAACRRHGGLTLGSHTWSHPDLSQMAGDEVDAELRRPAAWLGERFPRVVSWLAYPYGLTAPHVERAAEAAGYDAALLVAGGWASGRSASPRYALPRANIPAGLSQDGFALRISGALHR